MSWSVQYIGKAADVIAALETHGEKIGEHYAQSKAAYEEAKPHLIGLVQQNFVSEEAKENGYTEPVIKITASGSGAAKDGQQMNRSCSVSLEQLYGVLLT